VGPTGGTDGPGRSVPDDAVSPESPDSCSRRTRVLIVDDHLAFSGAIEIAINAQVDMISVGDAASVVEALDTVRRQAPDVVLMDVHLPDGDGITATKEIVELGLGTRVLILTAHTDVEVMARAASAGACGFLPKESSVGAVLRAIRAAGEGQMVVDGSTLAAILGRLHKPATAASDPSPNAPALTPREHHVLDLMGEGLDPHAIADELGISLNTCRGYQKSILAKLGAHSQLEAVVVASRRGLIGSDISRRARPFVVGQRARG
jgi:DNA-binding NarL/FixJ family response regulator